MIKYRTGGWGKSPIEEITVVKETEKSVWIDTGRKEPSLCRKEGYHTYHDTWEDAHAFLLGKKTRGLESAKAALDRAKAELDQIKGMKKPD